MKLGRSHPAVSPTSPDPITSPQLDFLQKPQTPQLGSSHPEALYWFTYGGDHQGSSGTWMHVRFGAGITRRGGRALTGANHGGESLSLKIDWPFFSSALIDFFQVKSALFACYIRPLACTCYQGAA